MNPPSPGECWDAYWDPAPGVSSGDRWQLVEGQKGKINIQSHLVLFLADTNEHEIHLNAAADKKPEQGSMLRTTTS